MVCFFWLQVKNHPVKAQPSDQPGSVILAKEPTLQVVHGKSVNCSINCVVGVVKSNIVWQANFARAVASLSKSQAKKVARFLPNPERHWGPKVKAGRQITSKHISLLGADAVNGALKHSEEESEEQPEAKRQKMEEETPPN